MLLNGPSFHGTLPCMLCRHWRRRKTPEEWRSLCGVCRNLSQEELQLLQWIQDEDDHVVVAPNILRHSRANSYARYAMAKAALDTARLGPRAKLLDIGCGTSAHASLFREFAYVGADLVRSRLRRGKANNPWALYAVQDITRLGWHDSAFDAVLCLEVIEHVAPSGRPALIRELLRVLRPGGIFVLTTPDGRMTNWKRLLGRRSERSHEAELPEEEISMLVAGAGGQLLETRVVDNLILPAGRLSGALLHMVADRPRWRRAVQRVSQRAGYATKLYVAAVPMMGSQKLEARRIAGA